jgi:hypothetical protein
MKSSPLTEPQLCAEAGAIHQEKKQTKTASRIAWVMILLRRLPMFGAL